MAETVGYGTSLNRVTTSTGAVPYTFAVVAAVHDLNGPNQERTDVEITTYDTTHGYREYKGGLREPGEIVATLNLLSTNATQQQLWNSTGAYLTTGPVASTAAVVGAFESDSLRLWGVRGPQATGKDNWVFNGYVKRIVQVQPIDDRRTWEVTFKVSGRPILIRTT